MSDLSAVSELISEFSTFNSLDFWRNVLLNTQQSKGNENSECLETFDGFQALYKEVQLKVASDVDYMAGLTGKGQGDGTFVGQYFDKMQ